MAETKDYQALAIDEAARRRAQRDEAEIQEIANALREQDERQARHAALRKKHGLPDHATPRQISDAWIAHNSAWGSFVACHFGGDARTGPILDPDKALLTDRHHLPVPADELERYRASLRAQRDKLRQHFDALPWPPPGLVDTIMQSATDGMQQLHGHDISRAA